MLAYQQALMKSSFRMGFSFGLTSSVITTLVLIVGLHAGTHSRAAVLGGIHGVNLTPLKDLLAALETAGVQIWICGACAVATQIGATDLVTGASIKGMQDYIKAVAEREKSIAF